MYSPSVLTADEAAQALDLNRAALTQARRRRVDRGDLSASPPFCRVGRSIRYLRSSLERWAAEHGHTLRAIRVPDERLPYGLDAEGLGPVVSDYQAQAILRISDCELRARRRRGDCPPWYAEGRAISWLVSDLLNWIADLERDETLGQAIARERTRPVAGVSAAQS